MKHRRINLSFQIPQPEFELSRAYFARWLPTRGNVLFTLLMIALLLWAQTAGALPLGLSQRQAPTAPSTSTIAYQGRLADADGNPLTATVSMVFRLYGQEAGGAPLWTEPWTGSNGVKVRDGLFNVMLGSLEPLPQAVVTGHNQLFLGITVDTDDEMVPRVQLGTVPFAVQALTVPDESVTTEKIADGAVTLDKLDHQNWIDLPLATGFHSPPNNSWQKAQYRRIGDIVYLRGTVTVDTGFINDDTAIANLPTNFRPPKNLAFVTEPHSWFQTKHRLNILPTGIIQISKSAGETTHVALDGVLFSISP